MNRVIGAVVILAGTLRAADLPLEARDLIARLGANQFAHREAAQQELLRRGETDTEAVLATCVAAYRQATDPEVKLRLRTVLRQLVETHVLKRPRGFLGIRMTAPAAQLVIQGGALQPGQPLVIEGDAVAPAAPGIQVINVTEDSPAARAGVQAGDQILKVDALDLAEQPSTKVFTTYVQAKKPGTKVELVVQRGDQTQTLPVELGPMPDEVLQQIEPRLRDVDAFFEEWLRGRLRQHEADSR